MSPVAFWLLVFLDLFLLILALGIALFYFVSIVWIGIRYGAPWVPTRKRITKEMVNVARLSGSETVLDLGCGDGVILFEALRQGKAKHVIGVDSNPMLIWRCRLLARLRGWEKQTTFLCADIRTMTLPKADVVMLYLLPPLMEKVRLQLKSAFPPETPVISNTFTFSGAPILQTIPDDRFPIQVYQVKDL